MIEVKLTDSEYLLLKVAPLLAEATLILLEVVENSGIECSSPEVERLVITMKQVLATLNTEVGREK